MEASSYADFSYRAISVSGSAYSAKSVASLLQSSGMPSVRPLALQNSSSGVDPSKTRGRAKVDLLRFEPADSRIRDDTDAVMSASHNQVARPGLQYLPAKLDSCRFIITIHSILLKRLCKQRLCLCNASAEHSEALLVVLLRRWVGADRGNVVLDLAEISHDFLNTHCANLVN